MLLSFIIPTKDRVDILFSTLEKLMDATSNLDNFEVIVVDDNSKTPYNLPAFVKNTTLIKNQGAGVASARNLGASISKASLLWFLDDDMWINENIISKAFELYEKYPDCAFNFNWIYPPYLAGQITEIPFGRFLVSIQFTSMKGWMRTEYWNNENLFETKSLAGATLLIAKNTFNKINGFDATFPFAGFEDYDFSFRLKKAGIKCYIEPSCTFYHNEVNKTSLEGFLKRTRNNSSTKKHAFNIGYADQEQRFPYFKRVTYLIVGILEPLFLKINKIWPNYKFLDSLYFRVCKLLIGYNNFKGYNYDRFQ